jgi:hypothetical protein
VHTENEAIMTKVVIAFFMQIVLYLIEYKNEPKTFLYTY